MTHRVALAHDWLTTYAGSERVLHELLVLYPGAPLLTSVVRRDMLPPELARAQPSLLQRVPGAVAHHEWMLPLMPLAWRLRRPVERVQAVVSSSHACAKAVRAAPGIPHLCYCHTPMRYAWDFASERARFPPVTRAAARAMMAGFRRWDRATASAVTRFVANSRAVAERIERYYGRRAQVVPPPVRTDFFTLDGADAGADFLYVGRLVGYKRADLAVEAFADLPHRLLVVGDGHLGPRLRRRATSNVTFLGQVSDVTLRELYRRARAMVFPADEDFGIAMAEAQACGTPVVSVDRGGARDIVVPGRTGWLARPDDLADLRRVLRHAATEELDRHAIRAHAERFSAQTFRDRMRRAVDEMIDDPRPC